MTQKRYLLCWFFSLTCFNIFLYLFNIFHFNDRHFYLSEPGPQGGFFFFSPFPPIHLLKVGETIRHEHMPHSRGASTATWFFVSYSQSQAWRMQGRDNNQDQGSSVRMPAFGSTFKRRLAVATVTHL